MWGIQVYTDIMGYPGVTFRVLLELFLAVVATEIIFLVPVFTCILRIVFINDSQADRIGCHCEILRVYHAPLPAKSMSDLKGIPDYVTGFWFCNLKLRYKRWVCHIPATNFACWPIKIHNSRRSASALSPPTPLWRPPGAMEPIIMISPKKPIW